MRSYWYHEGEWHLYKDTMPPTVLMKDDYEAGQIYEAALTKYGFDARWPKDYDSKLGPVKVYTRNHAKLAAERKANEPYDFLCCIELAHKSYVRVWITDLPNLLTFLNVIDTRQEEDDTVRKFL